MKIFVSFGQGHIHKINGNVIDKDCIVVFDVSSYEEGREKAFEYFGGKFCTTYTQEQIDNYISFFPRGFIELV